MDHHLSSVIFSLFKTKPSTVGIRTRNQTLAQSWTSAVTSHWIFIEKYANCQDSLVTYLKVYHGTRVVQFCQRWGGF